MAITYRSTTSKLLNSLLLICLMILTLASIPQIGVLAAVILVVLLCCWLIVYNYIWYVNRNNLVNNIETKMENAEIENQEIENQEIENQEIEHYRM